MKTVVFKSDGGVQQLRAEEADDLIRRGIARAATDREISNYERGLESDDAFFSERYEDASGHTFSDAEGGL